MRPEHHPRVNKLVIALLTPCKFKNKLRTIQPLIFAKIKNSQPELKLTGSYKKRVYSQMIKLIVPSVMKCNEKEFYGEANFKHNKN